MKKKEEERMEQMELFASLLMALRETPNSSYVKVPGTHLVLNVAQFENLFFELKYIHSEKYGQEARTKIKKSFEDFFSRKAEFFFKAFDEAPCLISFMLKSLGEGLSQEDMGTFELMFSFWDPTVPKGVQSIDKRLIESFGVAKVSSVARSFWLRTFEKYRPILASTTMDHYIESLQRLDVMAETLQSI